MFSDFISHDSIESETESDQDDCHSLRIIWEKLNQEVQIGKIKVNGVIREQLNPISAKSKSMLKSANASLTKKRRAYLCL